MKTRDITGQVYGRLIAIQDTGEKTSDGVALWQFRCDCKDKKVIVARKDNVTTGKKSDCGCVRREKREAAAAAVIGQKFGMLTAVRPTGERIKGDGEVWEFSCDCGETKLLPLKRVRKGHTRSCGCLNRLGQTSYDGFIGKTYGRLTLTGIAENKRYRNGAVGHFSCSCGKMVEKPLYYVLTGGIQSCGCLSREIALENMEKIQKKYVFGTNLNKIQKDESDLQRNNTSGIKGVRYEEKRGYYEAYLWFQKKRYMDRFKSVEEAIHYRAYLRQLHTEFVDWWSSLSKEERDLVTRDYPDLPSAKKAVFELRLEEYSQESR